MSMKLAELKTKHSSGWACVAFPTRALPPLREEYSLLCQGVLWAMVTLCPWRHGHRACITFNPVNCQ